MNSRDPTITAHAPQAFAQAELNGVERLRHLRHIFAEICSGVENSCAIEMNRNPRVVRIAANLMRDVRGVNGPARHVVSVLERNQRRLRSVVDLRTNRFRNTVPTQDAVRPDNARQHAATDMEAIHR